MKAEVKAEWVAALRSGNYKQGRNYLRQGDEFCCLGVLCDISGLGKWENDVGVVQAYVAGEEWEDVQLPLAVVEWADLESEDPVVLEIALASYNDGDEAITVKPHSFAEIADLIEAHL